MPDFSYEKKISKLFSGKVHIIGLDEVGRGPLAGPVVAAAVCIPNLDIPEVLEGEIQDSKKISKPKLEYLYEAINDHFIWAVAEATVDEIDQMNILQASLLAMKRAYSGIIEKIGAKGLIENRYVLIDGKLAPKLDCDYECIIGGDDKSLSVAAASIMAKVTRDRMMLRLAKDFPHYGWERNVGYPTGAHREAIKKYGTTPHHRTSFRMLAD